MNQRDRFYLTIGIIGLVIALLLWFMFGHAWSAFSGFKGLVLFLLLPGLFVVPNTLEKHLHPKVSRGLARAGGLYFIFAFYGALFGLVFTALYAAVHILGIGAGKELLTLYGRGVFFLLVLILARGYWNATNPVVRKITFETSRKLSKPVTIAFASDIHFGMVLGRNFAKKLVRDMNNLSPDIILFGGDIIDGNLRYVLREGTMDELRGLHPKTGTWAAFGNHDGYGEDIDTERAVLERNGMKCLRTETATIGDISITGMRDAMFAPMDAIPEADHERVSILIDHEPVRIREARDRGYDIYLAGHTHAGQFWPIRYITKKFFLLDYGTKYFGNMMATVTSGYGAWGALFRLGNKAEIILIRINSRDIHHSDIVNHR